VTWVKEEAQSASGRYVKFLKDRENEILVAEQVAGSQYHTNPTRLLASK